MLEEIRFKLQEELQKTVQKIYPDCDLPPIEVETPSDPTHGEFSTNIALKSAKVLRNAPIKIAGEIRKALEVSLAKSSLKGVIEKVEVLNPGFINFYLKSDALGSILEDILKQKEKYGQSDVGKGKKIQIEFVSANPTGPLSVAHARQAAVGDALVNILNTIGFKAGKEYYINDGGNQINILGQSLKFRALEILGEAINFPEDHYQGNYIKDMAQIFMDQENVKDIDGLNGVDEKKFSQFGATYLLDVIKTDLKDFGVNFDVWSYESKIATEKTIKDVLVKLEKDGHLYESEGALWFKTTEFGDDKDRVVRKSDGSYTYLTPDIVYHQDKFKRGFDQVIDILGPDHHGYISRIKAAAQALGKGKDAIEVLIVQLATIYRDGQPVSMSTRRGEFISLREVIDEVGVDAARFFFLMRHIKMHLDFDLELAKKQSSDNPVYYVQYAHARVHSINVKAKECKIKMKEKDFSALSTKEELSLIKSLGSFSQSLVVCHQQLDPFALVNYLQELASAFHKFYDIHRVVVDDPELSSQRLGLANAARIVLSNGLKILGVSTPEKM